MPTGVGYSALPIEAGSTPGSPQCGRWCGVGTADGGPVSTPSMRTVNVCAVRSAMPTTSAPVTNSVLKRPIESATVLCAGQNLSGTHCREVGLSHSYVPVIAGDDFDVERALGGEPVGDRRAERHHHRMRDAHHLASGGEHRRNGRRSGRRHAGARGRRSNECAGSDHCQNTPKHLTHGSRLSKLHGCQLIVGVPCRFGICACMSNSMKESSRFGYGQQIQMGPLAITTKLTASRRRHAGGVRVFRAGPS